MKLRIWLCFVVFASMVSASIADENPSVGNRLALETMPIGAQSVPMLFNSAKMLPALSATAAPTRTVSASQELGAGLSKMFLEGAAKLDAPRPKGHDAVAAAGGLPSGGRSVRVQAYSYCLGGRTASGRATAPGIVAVDTRVIPMGSRLYIPGYGWGVAADTGGAIVGNKIDVWFPTLGQCYQWGVRSVNIQVFPKK